MAVVCLENLGSLFGVCLDFRPLVRGLVVKESLPVRGVEARNDKFQVDQDWVLPEVMRLVPDGGRLDHQVRMLDYTYFDTRGAGLRLFGITLRRRVGGLETGWRLKAPNGTAHMELQSGSRSQALPAALGKGVAGLLAGDSLVPVARLVTKADGVPGTQSRWSAAVGGRRRPGRVWPA